MSGPFSAPVRSIAAAVSGFLALAVAAGGLAAGERGGHRHSSDESSERNSQPMALSQPAAAPQAGFQNPSGDHTNAVSADTPRSGVAGATSSGPSDDGQKKATPDPDKDGRVAQQPSAAPAPSPPQTTPEGDAQDDQRPKHSGAATDLPAEHPHRTFMDWLSDVSKPGETEKARPKGKDTYIPPPLFPGVGPVAEPVKPKAVPASEPTVAPARQRTAAPGGRVFNPDNQVIAPEVLAPGLSRAALQRAEALGFKSNGKVGASGTGAGMTRLLAPPGISADAARALLREALPGQDFGVNQVYRIYKTAAEPTDTTPPVPMDTPCGTDRCFGSNLIGWRPVLQACARKVRIGVIDTAFDGSHPTFQKRQIEVRPRSLALLHAGQPAAPNWHGTGVLAILAGEPSSGTPGLIPDGRFLAADVFFADANGLPVSDTASLIEALDWLEQRHADIINMSLTGPHDELLQGQIERMSKKGVLFVAAVGNDGPAAPPTYPSAYPQVLAVTAINKDLSSYRFANRGDHVDLAAPGVNIWTALPGGRATYHSGTSFAVPYVTAVLAAIHGGLATKSKAEALQHMNFVDLGTPGRDPVYGNGLVIAPYACGPDRDVPAAPLPTAATVVGTAAKQ